MTDTIEQLHRLWEDAAMTALENSRRATGENGLPRSEASRNDNGAQKNTAENGGEVKQSQRLGGYYPDIKVSTKDISIFGIKDINDLKEVKYRVYNYLIGKYVSNDKISKPIRNIDTGMDIYVYKGGIDETFGNTNAYKNLYTKNKKVKLATMTSLAKLIKYGEVRSPEAFNLHNPKSKNTYAYLTAPIVVDDITYTVNMDIKKTQHGNRFYVHTIKIASDSPRSDNSQTKYSNRSHNEVDVEVPGAKSTSLLKKSTSNDSISNPDENVKQKQLEIIQQTNPMWDDYHTGIRTTDDIHTWAEVLQLNDEREGQFVWGDFSRADAEQALKDGKITVYSSHPIKNGVFVSTSYIQAQEYAGGRNGKVYSKTIPLTDVAWINGDEGQYAEVDANNENGLPRDRVARNDNLKYSVRDYSYESLISKPDMVVSSLAKVSSNEMSLYIADRNLFAKDMIKNSATVGNSKNTDTKTYLRCNDLNNDILITKNSFKHGAARMDAAYIAVCKNISNVLENSIVVNEIEERNETNGGYVLLGIAESDNNYIVVRSVIDKKTWRLENYEELYAIRKKSIKKEDVGFIAPALPSVTGFGTSSKISISDFLKFVNSQKIANSVLSLDVIEKLNSDRNFDENITPSLLYSDRDPAFVSDRELLADALMSVVKNDGEYQILTDYKNNIKQMYMQQQKLDRINNEIKELKQTEPNWYTDSLKELYEEATKTRNRINNYDKKLLKLEAAAPLREVLKRERRSAEKKQREIDAEKLKNEKADLESKNREKLENYRESLKKTEMRRKIRHVISVMKRN